MDAGGTPCSRECGKGEGMEVNVQSVPRYRAKAARRPLLFWWQAFFLLGVVVVLWSQLPVSAVLYEARVFAPLPGARASYVLLTSADAAQALAKMRAAWTIAGAEGKGASDMELGSIDLNDALGPPSLLEQGVRYPGFWSPAPVDPLPQRLPVISVSSVSDRSATVVWPAEPKGVCPVVGPALNAAAFTFPLPVGPLPERIGFCRFYLETDVDGSVAHLLLLSQWTGAASVFEQALLRGHARCAARGFVDLFWSFPK